MWWSGVQMCGVHFLFIKGTSTGFVLNLFFFLTGGFGLSFWLILEDWLVFFSLWQYTKSLWVGFPLFHGRLIPKHVGTSSSIFNFKLNGNILLSFINASLGYILIYYFKKNLMKKWVFVLAVILILYKNFLKING